MKLRQHFAGHIYKMSVMPIYGKKLFKNLLSRNHLADFDEVLKRPKPFIICVNYVHELTLTYFMAMSNFTT